MSRPSSLADTGPEILAAIFSFLTPSDVAQCPLVCSKWKPVAQEQLYKDVNGFTSVAKFNSFMDTISNSPSNPGAYIKSLNLLFLPFIDDQQGGMIQMKLTKQDILTIGDKCPKVKSLLIASANSEVWEGLWSQVNSGHFQHLSHIPLPDPKSYLYYATTALALSKGLESLYISCLNIECAPDDLFLPISANREIPLQQDLLVNGLKLLFANLNELTVHEINGIGRSISRYDFILEQCPPSVKKLYYYADCYPDYARNADKRRTVSALTFDPSPNNTIKALDITGSIHIEEESVHYLMKKFQGLEQITLNIWELIDKLPKELMVDLFQYISIIRNKHSLVGYVNKGEESKITDTVATLMESSIKNNSGAPIFLSAKIVFTYFKDSQFVEDPTQMEAFGPIFVSYCGHDGRRSSDNDTSWLIDQGNGGIMADLMVEFIRNANEMVQTRNAFVESFLVKNGSRLNQLYISAYTSFTPDIRLDLCTDGSLFAFKNLEGNVLQYCNNLLNLELCWITLRGKGIKKNQIINNTLIRLKFNHACIDPASLSDLALGFPSLEELYVQNCAFVNSTLAALSKPAKIHMPNKSLNLLTLHWSGEYVSTWFNQYSKLHLKIFTTTSNHDSSRNRKKYHYYRIDGLEMKTIAAKEFNGKVKSDSRNCLSFDIACKDITTINIRFNGLLHQITSLDLLHNNE